MTTVYVKDGQFEKALRKFKKKVQESGILDELRERESYSKPTTKRRKAKNQAIRRQRRKVEQEEESGLRPARPGQLKRLY